MDAAEFIGYFEYPAGLNTETLNTFQNLLKEFPYFSGHHILLAKNHYIVNSTEKLTFLNKAAIFAGDRKKLFKFILDIPDDTIIQHHIPAYSIDEDACLKIINPENNAKDDLIEKFIREQPRPRLADRQVSFNIDDTYDDELLSENETPPTGQADNQEFLSETLAEIYWKQSNPDKAIQCYEKLSLKFPEKNTYFAAQIEKIKKEKIKY